MRYKFGLLLILIVFIFIEWSMIFYSEGPIINSFSFKLISLAKQKNIPVYSLNQISFYQMSKLLQKLELA